MNRLIEPIRRGTSGPYVPPPWPVRRRVRELGFLPSPTAPFEDAIVSRRSVRRLQDAGLRQVLPVARFALRTRAEWSSGGLPRSSALPASFGALHVVQLLIAFERKGRPVLFRYLADADSLDWLRPPDLDRLAGLFERRKQFLPSASGPLLIFAADMNLARAAYGEPESLVWRDAGALLQTMQVVAGAYRLGFCPLGLHGDEAVEALFGRDQDAVCAVGAAVIGNL